MVRTASLLSTLRTTGTAKSGRWPSVPAQERKALPLPVRLLIMLLAFVAMVAFAVALARLTLEPSPASKALIHTNLHPGSSLRAYLDQPALRDAVKQIGGNVVLGVPFGVLVPVLIPKARGILRVLLLTAVVMLLVELVQGTLITGRAFDIDDVILNTSGALVGYLLLGRRMGRAVHPKRRRKGLRNRGGAPKA
ncbi:VanZ family protein [Streptomyces mirabilis]|uniref:VanZ family protein n=1 Tax=Streptomyces mirabilis TaxID=68239 RepID=UPI0037902C91